MPKTAIVSDSTASLPASFVQAHNIYVVPLYIRIGEETLQDGLDMTPEEFYLRLPHLSALPTTSQPSVGDFQEVYRRAVAEAPTRSSPSTSRRAISGTVNSAAWGRADGRRADG
jgi:DegV family protein with EDD domain